MIKLKVLVMVSVLLLGLLPSMVSADEGHGRDWGSDEISSQSSLASGVSAVTVIPPGGSSQGAVGCSNLASGWAAALAGSNWISTQADCAAGLAVGDYQYSTSFNLSSNAAPLSISGSIMADDSVIVQLNGHTVFSGGTWTATSSFSSDDASLFNAGTNTLTFLVHNVGGPTGLDFVINVSSGAGPSAAQGDEENHGQCVSSVAHNTPRGRGHGRAVSQAARVTCRDGDDGDD